MKPKTYTIPFNRPHLVGKELAYIKNAHQRRQLAGDGYYTKKCQQWMSENFGCPMSLLTHSGTAALEMIAILSGLKRGEEVIMPDYTYVSTANAFVLRGIVPVFVDIRSDTLNLDETLIERAITKKTKAIMTMHYAGVGCEMDAIAAIAKKYGLLVLEDAAQGFLAKYKGRYLGTLSDLAAMSFHETKNIMSGEGGALFVNNAKYNDRARVVWEVGTNRSKFFMGLIHEYTWVDIGSSYFPGEVTASFLMAQMENSREITAKRISLWNRYHRELKDLEDRGFIQRPVLPGNVTHNAHIYRIMTASRTERNSLIEFLKKRGILAVAHYIPLHSSPGGNKFARFSGDMGVTNKTASTLIRLPLFYDLTNPEQTRVIATIYDFYKSK